MEWMKIIEDVILLVLVPLFGIGIRALVLFLKEKTAEISDRGLAEMLDRYIAYGEDVINSVVKYVAQTYVDALKAQGAFDKEAQEIAFARAKEAILKLLNEDAKEAIASVYGDIDEWIKTRIEQACRDLKQSTGVMSEAANETV